MTYIQKRAALEKLAWGWNPFHKDPAQIAEEERRKREEEARKKEEARLKMIEKMKDSLYDKNWGKGKPDTKLDDDKSILLPKGKYSKPGYLFSSATQLLPDSCLDWIRRDPGYAYTTSASLVGAPSAAEMYEILRNPSEKVYDFFNNIPALPANWDEFRDTMSGHFATKLAPDRFWTPMTNAVHYASQPFLTGGKLPPKDSPEMKRLANDFAERLAYGIRNNMETPHASGTAKK